MPFEEAVDRDDAAPPSIGVPERRKPRHRLGLGIDRLAAAGLVLAPARDEAPAQQVERALSGLMIFPDHQQFLARRPVVAGLQPGNAGVRRIQPLDDRKAQGLARLDDPAAHGPNLCAAAWGSTWGPCKLGKPRSAVPRKRGLPPRLCRPYGSRCLHKKILAIPEPGHRGGIDVLPGALSPPSPAS